jgi:hypothetical protein
MTEFEQEFINQAGGQIGQQESADHKNNGPAVKMYLASVGLPEGYAWCQAFVYWCAQKAADKLGIKNPLLQTGGCEVEFNSSRGTKISSPIPGCQFFLQEGGGGWHTGIVTGVFPGGVLHTIEGNTNGDGSREGYMVMRKTRNAAQMVGFKKYV